jgi:hypothetical protein
MSFIPEKDLPEVLSKNVDEVENLGDVQYGLHDREINMEMCYTLDDHGECSIEGFGFNYDNQEGSEEEIEARYDEREVEEISE